MPVSAHEGLTRSIQHFPLNPNCTVHAGSTVSPANESTVNLSGASINPWHTMESPLTLTIEIGATPWSYKIPGNWSMFANNDTAAPRSTIMSKYRPWYTALIYIGVVISALAYVATNLSSDGFQSVSGPAVLQRLKNCWISVNTAWGIPWESAVPYNRSPGLSTSPSLNFNCPGSSWVPSSGTILHSRIICLYPSQSSIVFSRVLIPPSSSSS